jgi:hypothetical protein
VARRSKDGSIIINVGADAEKHLDRVAKRERIASERAAKREAKKAATKQRQALRQAGKRAAQMARAIQRQRDTDARRKAAREARKNWKRDPNRKKRSVHPKGAFATEKYTSYARRLERSKKLRATRTSSTTFTCNGYTIQVTAGTNPKALSCTCPDFTQMEGGRDWKGSNAGPFNPCKHMMAVREGVTIFSFDVNVTSAFDGSNSFFANIYQTDGLPTDTFFFKFVADPSCDGVLFPASRRKDLIRLRFGIESTEYEKFICGSADVSIAAIHTTP